MARIHHQYAEVGGHRLFYREAGPADAPTLVLLHGFPASSFMFRNLIPALADRWHLIAPDLLGFGQSDAPPAAAFDYTFDSLAALTRGLLAQLGVDRYAMYVQDLGAPIGWRLALADPGSVTAVISQNGNAYEEGFRPAFFEPLRHYWDARTAETEAAVRPALTLEFTRQQYLTGVADASLVDPSTWWHDYELLSRPGNDLIQLQLMRDYATNPPLYPAVHRYFREHQVPLLAVWGRDDPIFAPAGALAFTADLPTAEVHLLDGGHFLLESALEETVPLIRRFLIESL
ncbi:alpha/beta fold hydrolase [Actinoplanes sp. L3-i22]|uniref:alpha/beta fold hydrolase n=1 Tax=Actinoplanes sp. L3-i22 TaxID=2836373 RepID=UPI001C7951F0|nr:alpha/beta hydrolase [Actinoplanes sp. L3-i22]BCY07242.1 hydrolase [Actinoplanes sp. L3-i22]